MATILNTTTSKGAGNYIGETKKQLRDGKISPDQSAVSVRFFSALVHVLCNK